MWSVTGEGKMICNLANRFPDDPMFQEQWHLNRGARGGFDMNVQPAWSRGYTGKGVVVSILDDGIQTNHPDLRYFSTFRVPTIFMAIRLYHLTYSITNSWYKLLRSITFVTFFTKSRMGQLSTRTSPEI
jgi:hypothetical protein